MKRQSVVEKFAQKFGISFIETKVGTIVASSDKRVAILNEEQFRYLLEKFDYTELVAPKSRLKSVNHELEFSPQSLFDSALALITERKEVKMYIPKNRRKQNAPTILKSKSAIIAVIPVPVLPPKPKPVQEKMKMEQKKRDEGIRCPICKVLFATFSDFALHNCYPDMLLEDEI